jgi:cytochrome c-type biogenesis protein CcmH
MKKKIYISLTVFVLMFIFLASLYPAEAQTYTNSSPAFKTIASQFQCNCGCGENMYECDPSTCDVSKQFKSDLLKMMNKGWSNQKIRNYYINIYGESILSAPEKSGFSLTAWVLPFVALGAATIIVVLVIRKWVKKNNTGESVSANENDEDEVENEILSSIIEEERKKYL